MQLTIAIRNLLATVCHQLASRSFCGHGGCLPLCQRCTGIYVGVALVAAYWRFRAAHIRILPTWPAVAFLVCALGLLILNVAGVVASQPAGWCRFVTGTLAGAGVAMVASPLAFGEHGWERGLPSTATLAEVAVLGAVTVATAVLGSLIIRYAIVPVSIVVAGLVLGAFVSLWAAFLRGVGWAIRSTPPRRRVTAGMAAALTILQFALMWAVRK
jgi:uncharacterized membrane protein